MAVQRDVTTLTPVSVFADDGYVLVVQDNDIYALPKSVWTNEIYEQYKADLDTWKADFDAWYASVKGTFANNDSQASDIAILKNQIKKCVMEDEGSIVMDSTSYKLPADAVKLDDDNTVQAAVDSMNTMVTKLNSAVTGVGYSYSVGTYLPDGTESPVSVPSNTPTTVQELAFAETGTYLIDTDVNFTENAKGTRTCKIAPTKNNVDITRSAVTAMPVSGEGTAVTFQTIVSVKAGKVYYINVKQTSGVNLNVNARCRIVKVSNTYYEFGQ